MYLVNKPSLSDLRSELSLQNPTPSYASTSHETAKHNQMIYAMATCHSLRVVDNDLLGDPLDVKMFQFTGWSYQEGGGHVNEQVSNFDTITPSIARPPVSEEYLRNGTQNELSVSGFFNICSWRISGRRLIYVLRAPSSSVYYAALNLRQIFVVQVSLSDSLGTREPVSS